MAPFIDKICMIFNIYSFQVCCMYLQQQNTDEKKIYISLIVKCCVGEETLHPPRNCSNYQPTYWCDPRDKINCSNYEPTYWCDPRDKINCSNYEPTYWCDPRDKINYKNQPPSYWFDPRNQKNC